MSLYRLGCSNFNTSRLVRQTGRNMYGHPQQGQSADEVGRWRKGLRETTGLSQRQFAARLGLEYYTFISQIEAGRGRIPPDRYEIWAETLGIAAAAFVRELMRYYDPNTYRILFGARVPTADNDA